METDIIKQKEEIKVLIRNGFDVLKNKVPRPVCPCCSIPLSDEEFLNLSLNNIDKMNEKDFKIFVSMISHEPHDQKTS